MERPRMTMTAARLDQLAIDTIRALAIDAVQRANSAPPRAGPPSVGWSEDVVARFDAYAWHPQRVDDGNDVEAVAAAVTAAQADPRPSLIAGRPHLGYRAPP